MSTSTAAKDFDPMCVMTQEEVDTYFDLYKDMGLDEFIDSHPDIRRRIAQAHKEFEKNK